MSTTRARIPTARIHQPVPVRAALRELHAAQKPGAGVPAYTRWVNRRLAHAVTAVAQRVGLSPSQVSVMSLSLSIGGILSLVTFGRTSPWAAGFMAAVLLATGFVLDSADGQLARLTGRSSLAGEWLDHTFDAIRLPLVHLAVAVAATGLGHWWLAGIAALFSVAASAHFLSQNLGGLLRDQGAGHRRSVHAAQSWLLLPTDPGVLCWLFALWGWQVAFTTAYTALFGINLVHISISARRRWHELSAIDEERRHHDA